MSYEENDDDGQTIVFLSFGKLCNRTKRQGEEGINKAVIKGN